jgi:hypothetical protein
VPLAIVTVPLLIVQTEAGVAVIAAVVLAFVLAETVNVDWYTAVEGAPVKVAVGAIFAALVVCVAVAAL